MGDDGKRWIVVGVVVPLLVAAVPLLIIYLPSGSKDKPAAAPPSASPVDPCLVGLWQLSTGIPDSIDLGDGTQLKADSKTGGFTFHFGSDRHGEFEAAMDLTARRSDGVKVEQVFQGVDSFTFTADARVITYTAVSDNGTKATFIDGKQVSVSPQPASYVTFRYTCTSTHLSLVSPAATIELDRI